MTDHMGQIAEWYEQAERITKTNLPNDGDTIIYPGSVKGSYIVEPNTEGWEPQIVYEDEECRILARAPKPAWHDAPAVIASTDYCERQVWQRDTTHENRWYGTAGDGAVASDLRDATPLVEAKVTDEMVKRALCEGEALGYIERTSRKIDGIDQNAFRAILTAALGLEIA